MKGDRIVVGTGYVWTEFNQKGEREHVMVYAPTPDQRGAMQVTPDGGVVVSRQGAVVAGSTGTIDGEPIKVHRSYLHNYHDYPVSGGNDFINMVPVFFDRYQLRGWLPVENIRIFSGPAK
jgi:hypothetical protein